MARQTFYDSMKKSRLAQKLSIAKLSRMSGVSEASICLYETGKQAPGLFNLMALAEALDVSLDRYVGYTAKRSGGSGN